MLNHGFHGRLGLLAETVVEILEKDLGYKVEVGVLNAANYGVPQLRERAIFMASAIGPVCLPEATHADPRSSSFKASDKKPWVTVREAISDLSLPSQIDEHNDVLGLSKYLETSSEYANLMRSKKNYPCNHDTRSYRNSVIEIITEMGQGETWDSASLRMRKKYEEMTERYAKRHSITISEANNSLVNAGKIKSAFFKNYYWSAYTRLAWDAPALTITANANFLGSGRFTHPEQMRGITAREAARLQSFDDDFKFITSVDDKNHTNKIGVSMDMIGEAVPPLLAQALATRIANDLDK